MTSRTPRASRQVTRQLDETLRVFQNAPRPPTGGWVRVIRESLSMTRSQFAKRLGIARPNTYKLEADEVSESVSLARLSRAADALDCRLVYALIPKISLEETVKRQAFEQAKRRLERVNISQSLEASALSDDSISQQIHDIAMELIVERPHSLWDD